MKYPTQAPLRSATRLVPALLLAGFSPVLAAEESPVTELPSITVSAHSGTAIPYDSTGCSVTVLDIPQLEKEGIYSLSEALTTVPGVFVTPGGGLSGRGNASKAIIRGLGRDSYLLPMIDGMLANTSNGSSLVTSNLIARSNLFDLGNVEVLRGAQAASYGGGAISGVLFMETPRGEGKPGFRLFQEHGSNNAFTSNISTQGQLDKLHFFLSSTYETTENDIRSADGTRPADPGAGSFENFAQALRLDYELNESTVFTTTYRREDAEYQYSGKDWYGGGWMPNELRTFRSNLITARVESKVNSFYTASLMGGYYGTDNMFGRGSNHDLRNVQVEWRHVLRWCRHQTTTAHFRWTRSQFDSTSIYEPRGNDNINRTMENVYSLALEHTWQPTSSWTSSLAARLDYSSIHQAMPTVRASSSYSFNDDATRIFGSFGRGYRSPGSFERSSGVLPAWGYALYHGNPRLKCETSWSGDLGIEHQLGETHLLSLTWFWQQTKDYIRAVPKAGEYYFVNDPAHWTSQGVEMAFTGELGDAWNTGYTLAFTYAQPKDANDAALPDSCRQVWSADIHTSPLESLTVGLGAAAVTGRRDYDGSRMDSYCTLRCYAEYAINEHLKLHARVENMTDEEYVTDSSSGDILATGTAFYGGFTFTY